MTDSWVALRRFTQARDAVHCSWDIDAFAGQVRGLGEEVLILHPTTGRFELRGRRRKTAVPD